MDQNGQISETISNSIDDNEPASEEAALEPSVENVEKVFENEVQKILEKLGNLPSTASELKIPVVTLDIREVYAKLCKALNVPINSTFLSSIESEDADFSYQCLGPVGIIPTAKAMTLCKTVKVLDLKHNRLGTKSLPAIISLLDLNEHITHLNLSSNDIGKGSAHLLSEIIAHCHSVEFLDLSNNDLGDVELQEIGLALMKIDTVKELNLNTNDFSSAKAPQFGSFINKCSALLRLDISCCHLEEGATNIFGGLKISNMTNLNLSRNGIPNESMSALASGLRANKSLQELDISFNSISYKGAIALAPGLKGSSTLEVIKLAHNPIQGQAATTLLGAVGTSLKLLDLSGIKVNLAFLKTLKNYAKTGKGVKVLYGSEIRYDTLPRDFAVPAEGAALTNLTAIPFLEKLAEEKGLSLRNVLKGIHATFITDQHGALPTDEGDKKQGEQKREDMKVVELARHLVASPVAVPKDLAEELAELLCAEGYIDMWDLISKVSWRPDDLFVKIKGPKKPPPEKGKEKGKKK